VPVYEFGRRAEGNKPFYTMRFVRGQTLRQVVAEFHRRGECAEEPLERLRLLHAFVSICNAISFAHSRGVIHRDLKPENVILGGFGEVLVLDWGLARTMNQPTPDVSVVRVSDSIEVQATLSGHILGTPAYMSPEQAAGNIDQIEHRTDVYGLGAILFEVLAGRPPHMGGNSATLLKRIIQEPTPRAHAVVPSTPPALDAVCAHAMEKNPAQRYTSAKDLARDIERYLADEPVSVYREPVSVRAGRFVRRHRTAVSVATATLFFLTAGAVVGLFLWQSARDKRRAEPSQPEKRNRFRRVAGHERSEAGALQNRRQLAWPAERAGGCRECASSRHAATDRHRNRARGPRRRFLSTGRSRRTERILRIRRSG
jgi:serine/threonine protein kinase